MDAFGGRAVVRRWKFSVQLACGDERRFGNLAAACTGASAPASSGSPSCDTPTCHAALQALAPDDAVCLPHLANVSEQIAPWWVTPPALVPFVRRIACFRRPGCAVHPTQTDGCPVLGASGQCRVWHVHGMQADTCADRRCPPTHQTAVCVCCTVVPPARAHCVAVD